MPVVAIVEGTGSVGRFIIEEIVADGKFEVIVLSFKANPTLEKDLGTRILPIGYSDLNTITTLLEENHVDIVIAALGGRIPPEQEHGLIQAAAKSKATKRYTPASGVSSGVRSILGSSMPAKLSLFDALEKTDFELTAVTNGFFLDYRCAPNLKTCLEPLTIVLDVPGRKAAIPGNPDQPAVFTYTKDVAKFRAKLLTLERREPVSHIIGDRLTWKEFAQLTEEVTGKNLPPTPITFSGYTS
ncbi:hypothetical protein FGADI_1665 [Fusarium gaditjirri]|uniref:NmrA-like domain-containing protein n=1 Tax=Fusarium gaditjirri TaxID=282569 RepID=A0A8H4TKJ6_9HYPO|nr:hypothetical protein FGADI_1665 [Fusarium gaditjirri]